MKLRFFMLKFAAICLTLLVLMEPLAPLVAPKPAYAAVPTIETHPLLLGILPRDQFEYINRILTEIVKGQILNLINQIVDQYIKGSASNCPSYLQPLFNIAGGQDLCPKFVTNWETFLYSAERRADLRLQQEVERANISEANRQELLRFISPTSEFGQTFDEVFQFNQVCDPNTIEDPFAQIQCVTDPANSIDLQYAIFAERREKAKEIAREADKSKAVAGEGYLGTEQCADDGVLDPRTGQPVCLRGIVTKPGIIDKEIQAEAKKSDIHRVVNAFNLESLLGGLINLFINQLIQQGLDGLLGLIGRPPLQPGQTPFPPIATPPPPMTGTITISANPQTIDPGQSSLITWNAPGADSCAASGAWSGTRAASGSEVVAPLVTSTYTLTCVDQYGSQATASITITVTSGGGGGGGGGNL